MTKNEYRKQFLRAIRFAPRKLRQEIVHDFEAILEEAHIDEDNLLRQLGSPQELAQQYLEGVEIAPSTVGRMLFFARNLAAIVGIVAISTTALIFAVLYYYANYRDFEYSDQSLAENHPDYTAEYTLSFDKESRFSTEQANLVVYSHDKGSTLLRCQKADEQITTTQTIEQNACLLFLPQNSDAQFSLEQTTMTIIAPKANIDVTSRHATVNVFQAEISYNIAVKIDQATSDLQAIQQQAPYSLNFDLFQSSLNHYEPS